MKLIDVDMLIKDMYEDSSFPLTMADKVTEKINKQRVVYENGWIPADEPPEDNNYILISFENFSIPVVGRYEENEKGGAYYAGDEDITLISQDMIVNAWQPLPDRYYVEEGKICSNKECPYYTGNNKCSAFEVCPGAKESNRLTNADKIRSLSDEELAKFLVTFKNTFGEEYEGEKSCLDWLKDTE